jgi:hypothetical protein
MTEKMAQIKVLSPIKEVVATRRQANLNSVLWLLSYSQKSEKLEKSQNFKLIHLTNTKTIQHLQSYR